MVRRFVSFNADIVLDVPDDIDVDSPEWQNTLRREFIDYLESAEQIQLSFEIGEPAEDDEEVEDIHHPSIIRINANQLFLDSTPVVSAPFLADAINRLFALLHAKTIFAHNEFYYTYDKDGYDIYDVNNVSPF